MIVFIVFLVASFVFPCFLIQIQVRRTIRVMMRWKVGQEQMSLSEDKVKISMTRVRNSAFVLYGFLSLFILVLKFNFFSHPHEKARCIS